MSDNFSSHLAHAIEKSGRAKGEIAKAIGVQPPALSRWLSGTVPEAKHLAALARELNVNVNWLISEDRKPSPGDKFVFEANQGSSMPLFLMPHYVPLLSWAHAGESTSYEELPKHWQEQISIPTKIEDGFALTIEGDSMEPRCMAGDIVIIMPREEPRNGCLVVAKLRDDGVVLRRYAAAKGIIRLTPQNPIYPSADYTRSDFHWIYPVSSTMRKEW
jgi:SOS-response transcriptional repressor LexA